MKQTCFSMREWRDLFIKFAMSCFSFLLQKNLFLKIGIKKAPLGAILKGKIYVLQLKKQALACKKMVGVKGFEPSASWSQTTRATKLRHTPMS